MDLPPPPMKLVDMSAQITPRQHKAPSLISTELHQRLRDVLDKGEQAILLLNRRGYSNFVFCPSCRYTLGCKNCDVTLTFHKRPLASRPINTIMPKHIPGGFAICHYCLAKTLVPQTCPLCKKKMTMIGLGSQRLEEELADRIPNAKVRRVDSDSMAGGQYYSLLRDFADGRIDILAGTQMLAKGLHFPNVTLVGIINADTALSLPDFRANERTFQLISQVAGRAGRSKKLGVVIVQTFLPGQPAIQFALKHDYKGFVTAELSHRKQCNLPPYWRMAIVRMRDIKFDKLTTACNAMHKQITNIISRQNLNIRVRGPIPAVISRIQRFHRMQIILQAPTVAPIQQLFATLRAAPPLQPAVKVAIDIDPVNLL